MILLTKDKNFNFGKSVKSPIYPSELPIAYYCMGSVLLHKETEPHPLAKIGKKAHAEVERCLKEGIEKKKKVLTDMKIEGDENLLNDYLNYVYFILSKGFSHFGVECYVDDPFYNVLVGGICDLFYVSKGRLTVLDLKTGYGKMKELHWWQLYFYAFCLGIKLELAQEDEIDLVFYTRWGIKEKTVIMRDLYLFKNKVCREIKTGMPFNVGKHCADCYKFSRCETVQSFAKKYIKEMSEEEPKDIEKYFKHRKIIEKFFKEAEQAVIDKHDRKENIGNFLVYETPGRKYWKAEVMDDLYKNPDMIEHKLISVAQAKKKGFDIEGKYDVNKSKKAVLK